LLADSAPRNAGDVIAVESKSLVVLRAWVAPETEIDHSVAASLSSLASNLTSAPIKPEVS
jgi:isoamylase